MKAIIRSFFMLMCLTAITGLAYPILITVVAKELFPGKSSGSMIEQNNRIIGSELIGQSFTSPGYFWPRPSAIGNNPTPSGGSNLSPNSKALYAIIQERLSTIKKYHSIKDARSVPPDLLFASASGVDPHISPEAARFQMERVARLRRLSIGQKIKLKGLVQSCIEKPQFGLLGEPRINVLKLNMRLDSLKAFH